MNENLIVVEFMMRGRKFAFTKNESKWSNLGKIAYPRKGLFVDNINIFEASWWIREQHKGAENLDDVISKLMSKIFPHNKEITAFARKNRLVFSADIYIEYESGFRPLTGISLRNLRRLAAFKCPVGWETVVKQPNAAIE